MDLQTSGANAVVHGQRGALGRGEQLDGVRVAGPLDDRRNGSRLDDAAVAHHHQVVGHQRHQGDVVGDEQQRRALGGDQFGEQRQHLGLHGDVERGRRLVGDQQRRPAGEGDGDADALSLTSGELVRIGACGAFGFGQPDPVAQLDRRPSRGVAGPCRGGGAAARRSACRRASAG